MSICIIVLRAVSIHPDVLSALNGLSELLIEDKNAGIIYLRIFKILDQNIKF